MTLSNNSSYSRTNIAPELAQYPYLHNQSVDWGDMDAFNHVNNVVYYRYAENARIGYMQQLNMFTKTVTTVLAKSECTYIAAVTYPDTLIIGVQTKSLGNTSIVMQYCFYSTQQQQVVAMGESVLVRLDSDTNAKIIWTAHEREQIFAYEHAVGHTLA